MLNDSTHATTAQTESSIKDSDWADEWKKLEAWAEDIKATEESLGEKSDPQQWEEFRDECRAYDEAVSAMYD
ncbi:MAG: hypothetical protein AAFN38_21795 [Cyanobacteria bacterium J06560_5]